MHHSYLDKYARQRSPLHELDARVKLIITVLAVVLIATVPHPGRLFVIVLSLFIVLLCLVARISLGYLLSRSAIVLPFSGFAAVSYALTVSEGEIFFSLGSFALTTPAIQQAVILLLRSWLAVCFMIILINTCPFDRLLSALHRLRVPALLVLLLSFFYRYLYLLWDEAERMQRARNLRYFGGRWKEQPVILGRMVTTLFLRSYERSERVALAMQARGWDGETWSGHPAPLKLADLSYLALGFLILFALWMIRQV